MSSQSQSWATEFDSRTGLCIVLWSMTLYLTLLYFSREMSWAVTGARLYRTFPFPLYSNGGMDRKKLVCMDWLSIFHEQPCLRSNILGTVLCSFITLSSTVFFLHCIYDIVSAIDSGRQIYNWNLMGINYAKNCHTLTQQMYMNVMVIWFVYWFYPQSRFSICDIAYFIYHKCGYTNAITRKQVPTSEVIQ